MNADDGNSTSVYTLITRLCELFLTKNARPVTKANVKHLRNRIYTRLLFRGALPPNDEDEVQLDSCTNFYMQYEALVFMFKYAYHLPETSRVIERDVQVVKNSSYDPELVHNILKFIYLSRQAPPIPTALPDFIPLENAPCSPVYGTFSNDDFQLDCKLGSADFTYFADQTSFFSDFSEAPQVSCTDLSEMSDDENCFNLEMYNREFHDFIGMQPPPEPSWSPSGALRNEKHLSIIDEYEDDEDDEDDQDEDDEDEDDEDEDEDEESEEPLPAELAKSTSSVWNFSKEEMPMGRCAWHALGDSEPPPHELPLLGGASPRLFSQMDAFNFIATLNVGRSDPIDFRWMSMADVVRDIRSLLIGIPSETFYFAQKRFFINPMKITDWGMTRKMFFTSSRFFLNAGDCYRALTDMLKSRAPYPTDTHDGFIFQELVQAVRKFAAHYRMYAMSYSGTSMATYARYMRPMAAHLYAVAALLRVGVHAGRRPSGVEILNVLYRRVVYGLADRVVQTYHFLLTACLRAYFVRFLQSWLFEGVVNDPHGEFFVRVAPRMCARLDRTYWTHAFTMRARRVPVFLRAHARKIFINGKHMSLLKLCNPQSFVCAYLDAHRPTLMTACFTSNELERLAQATDRYYLELIEKGGLPFSLATMLEMKRDEDTRLTRLVYQQRRAVIKRIEAERLAKTKVELEEKQARIARLKAEYDAVLVARKLVKVQQLHQVLCEERRILELQEERDRIIRQEAAHMLDYYANLWTESQQFQMKISRQLERIRKIQLSRDEVVAATVECGSAAEEAIKEEVKSDPPRQLSSAKKRKQKRQQAITELVVVKRVGVAGKRRKRFGGILPSMNQRGMPYLADYNPIKYGGFLDEPAPPTPENFHEMYRYGLIDIDSAFISTPIETTPIETTLTFQAAFESLKRIGSVFDAPLSPDAFVLDQTQFAMPLPSPQNKPQTGLQKRLGRQRLEKQLVPRFLDESVAIPLEVHSLFVSRELLRYLVADLDYLAHLRHFRDVYFLLDCELSTAFSRLLFTDMRAGGAPFHAFALRQLIAHVGDTKRMRLTAIGVPQVVHAGDIGAFDKLALHHTINWPLNVLFPADMMAKYNEIFRFLLKVNRVTWTLHAMFRELKLLHKQLSPLGARLLPTSSQYQRVQLVRHTMAHFVDTYRTYVAGVALQTGWAELEEALHKVNTFDDLYAAHAGYLKHAHFLCSLNAQSAPIHKAVVNIFRVILKYDEFLHVRDWHEEPDSGVCTHPAYARLERLFENFLELVRYFLKVGAKVARAHYQPQLALLIETLDYNGFYSKLFGIVTSC